MSFLVEAAANLDGCLSHSDAVRMMATITVPRLCDVFTLDLLEDGQIKRLAAAHRDPAREKVLWELSRGFPIRPDSDHAIARVLRSGVPVIVESPDDEHPFPMTLSKDHRELIRRLDTSSLMILPLIARGRTIGAVLLGKTGGRRFTAFDRELAPGLAKKAAMSIDNALLYENAVKADRRSTLLLEISRLLAEPLEALPSLGCVARKTVASGLASICILDLVTENGTLERVAVETSGDGQGELLKKLLADPPSADQLEGITSVLATRSPAVIRLTDVDHLLDAGITSSPICARAWKLDSAIIAPIAIRGRTLGAMTLLLDRASGRSYTLRDAPLVQEIGARVALALDSNELYSKAQEALRARNEFISVVSHELRTPLTSMTLLLQLMQRFFQTSDATAREMLPTLLAQAEKQSIHLTQLIHDLLDLSRIESGRFELKAERVDLVDLTRDVIERYARPLSDVNCRLSFSHEGPAIGAWDPARLEQVVTNLLSNAMKFGGGKPIEIRIERGGGCARLIVKDQGKGIPIADHERIFQRFERAESSRDTAGLGLGLYICRQIVHAHDGEIGVRSSPGEGATFVVTLPLAAETENQASA